MQMNFRLTLFTCGILLVILGGTMLLPGAVDYSYGYTNYAAFFLSAIFCFFLGGALVLSNTGKVEDFNIREGFLLTTVSWLLLSFIGALPLYLSDLNLSYADAFFESVSGITTTGSTVLTNLDYMSRGILLWRSILQWIGGIGIVAFAIFLLPYLKVGGMQLFRTESSDRSDKSAPKARQLVGRLLFVYVFLTGLCFVVYYELGMPVFDAINHAMTTLSTGGYSTHDLSIGHYNNALIYLAATFFMLLGGLPFVLFVKFIFHGEFDFFKDSQVRAFLFISGGLSLVLAVWLYTSGQASAVDGLVHATFNIVSILTTTGYTTTDYTLWGPFAAMVFFFAIYVGGCAGSTAGGIKMMRLLILMEGIKGQTNKLIYPNGVFVSRYQGRPIDNSLIINVLSFLALYVLLNAVVTIFLTCLGLDLETAFSAAATSVANVGPGIGPIIGPAGNFSSLPDSAKWVLSAAMFLGRLEIATVLVIFSAHFWRP